MAYSPTSRPFAPVSSVSPTSMSVRSTPPPPIVTNRSASNVSSPPRQTSLECDYDVNPTYLYQAIEAREWEHAKKVFEKPGAYKQAATWVTRKETNGKLRWRLLPIHAAIIFKSPLELVELLLQEYPTCAQCKDDQGMLPLHLAFRNGSDWDILEELLTSNPQGIAAKDRKGRTPIQCASSVSRKQASVMELYTQISLSTERQRALQESRSVLEARLAALQDSHVKTLTALKDECQAKLHDLEQTLLLKEDELQTSLDEINRLQGVLKTKEATEVELTNKLSEVSMALETMSKMRAADETIAKKKNQEREKQMKEANNDLLLLVQSLLDQQTSIKVALDKQAWESKDKLVQVEGLVHQLSDHNKKLTETQERERDVWRGLLEESNHEVSERLARVLEKTRLVGEATAADDLLQVQAMNPLDDVSSIASSVPGIEKTRNIGSSMTSITFLTDEKKDEMAK